jgi:hypothetical protein
MSSFYFGLTAVLGAVTLCLCLVVLVPQGMWMYLLGLVWGTFVLTWSLLKLREESKAQDSDPYPHINTI